MVIIDTIRTYGLELMREFGIEHSQLLKQKKGKASGEQS
jgi:hypothetical protein